MDNLLTVMLLCYRIALSSGGNLYLIGSPSNDGGLFTLTCGNRRSGSRAMNWYLNDSMAFTTSYEPGEHNDCILGIQGSSPYRYMAERVTVSCDTHQHNVTLTINSTLDSGSVWFCENNTAGNALKVTRARSVKLIINVGTTESTSTYGSSTSSTVEASIPNNNIRDIQNDLYIVAAAVGGAVVTAVVFVLVLWVRRRLRRSHDGKQNDDVPEVPAVAGPNTVNMYDSPSTPEDVEHKYCQVQGGTETPNYVNTDVVNAATDLTAEGETAEYYSCVGNA